MLTPEERSQLNCDCHRMPVLTTYPLQRRHRDTCPVPVVESIVSARVRAARAQELRDAAVAWYEDDYADSVTAITDWLRDRAETVEKRLG